MDVETCLHVVAGVARVATRRGRAWLCPHCAEHTLASLRAEGLTRTVCRACLRALNPWVAEQVADAGK